MDNETQIPAHRRTAETRSAEPEIIDGGEAAASPEPIKQPAKLPAPSK